MQTIIDTRSAFDVIKDTYDVQTLGDIVTNGCVSGVAHDHIYYKDTVAFFDKYEDEMIKRITDNLGEDTVKSLWNKHPNNITGYKNDVTWSFIELVAMAVVDSDELYAIQA
jgi:predicted RND superfamily exporter protein